MMTGRWAQAFLLILLLAGPAWAEIHHWVDDQGTQHYTTDPEKIPDRYRSRAQTLSLPPSPPAPPELTPVGPSKKVIQVPFKPGSSVLVSAKINGAGPVPLILDTGADRTLITSSAFANLGVSAEKSVPVYLQGVTGAAQGEAIWVDSVEVGEAKVGPLLITIHDTSLKGAGGLLGRDFLAHFNVILDSGKGLLTLEPHAK
jgi:hypothetical protein